MNYSEEFYRTNHYSLFLDCVRFAQARILETEQNIRSIPWAIIGAHSLAQMSCIVALDERDTTQTACLSDRKLKRGVSIRQKTVQLLHSGQFADFPAPYLASPVSLLRRVQDKTDVMEAQAFTLDDDMKWNLNKLNEFRDMVIHFLPSSWSLELDGMPNIFKSAFELALLTVRTPGAYRHRLESNDRKTVEQTCLDMIDKLSGENPCTLT